MATTEEIAATFAQLDETDSLQKEHNVVRIGTCVKNLDYKIPTEDLVSFVNKAIRKTVPMIERQS